MEKGKKILNRKKQSFDFMWGVGTGVDGIRGLKQSISNYSSVKNMLKKWTIHLSKSVQRQDMQKQGNMNDKKLQSLTCAPWSSKDYKSCMELTTPAK